MAKQAEVKQRNAAHVVNQKHHMFKHRNNKRRSRAALKARVRRGIEI